jgi:hypothetical protein
LCESGVDTSNAALFSLRPRSKLHGDDISLRRDTHTQETSIAEDVASPFHVALDMAIHGVSIHNFFGGKIFFEQPEDNCALFWRWFITYRARVKDNSNIQIICTAAE